MLKKKNRLDEDESGGLAYNEFKEGVKQFSRHKLLLQSPIFSAPAWKLY